MLRKIILILSIGIITCFPLVAAQKAPPIVKEIVLDVKGPQTRSDEAILSQIKLVVGQEYDQKQATQSIKALYKTGLFRTINIRIDEIEESQVIVTFEMESNPIVDAVNIEGNRRISCRKLYETIETKIGIPINEAQLTADVEKIRKLYEEKGHSGMDIRYVTSYDDCTGKAVVTFCIDEGKRVRVQSICFIGHEPIKRRCLLKVMQIKERHLLSFLTGAGKFKEDAFVDDLQRLKDYFRDQGYLDVEIPESGVTFSYSTPTSMCITITVNKGRVYCIGDVCISGNTLYSAEKLMGLLCVKPGQTFSPSSIERDREMLVDAYGQVGYLDTDVVALRKPNLETGAIDVEYIIQESEKFFVETVTIQGNTKTKSRVILRELLLEPGDIFDLVRMKNSQARLQNTEYFDEVNLIPEMTNIPGRRNLNIAVKEARTGSVNFGVAINSVEKLVGSVEITQSNFDFKNYRSWFQGAGQKFSLGFHFGARSKVLQLSFEEPSVCDRELAFGFNVFYKDARYLSSLYDETRTGLELYLRKRLFERVVGSLSYQFEVVDIRRVNAVANSEIQKEKGYRTVSKAAFTLSRDTRDNYVYPTQGSILGLGVEVAGLGGQTRYVALNGNAAFWCSPFEDHVFLAAGRTGTIIPYGGSNVPFFDRYFLGGPDNLRGFVFKGVGPRIAGEPVGGNTWTWVTAEYSVRILEPLRVAVFYDGGFVARKELDWDFSKYNDDVGFGLRIFVMGAPLRLDWGIPLRGDGVNDKKKLRFHFSYGIVF